MSYKNAFCLALGAKGKGQGAWITEDELVVDSLRLAINPIDQGKLPIPRLHAPC